MKSSEIIFEVTESPEGGSEARALSASIFTEADSIPELEEAVRDAVRCHFDEGFAPAVIRQIFSWYLAPGTWRLEPTLAASDRPPV